MKKVITIFAFILLTLNCLNAKENPLRLQSGSLTALKNAGGYITCELDFSKAKGNKKPLKEYLNEDSNGSFDGFMNYVPEMLQWFMERWDDDIEKGPKATSSTKSPYKLKIIIKNVNLGANSGYGAASISGKAEFYKEDQKEPFAVVEILKMNGTILGGGVPGYFGLKQCFSDLAEYLCDLVYHSK